MKVTFDFLFRKKKFLNDFIENTLLSRVLGLFDITALGKIFIFNKKNY